MRCRGSFHVFFSLTGDLFFFFFLSLLSQGEIAVKSFPALVVSNLLVKAAALSALLADRRAYPLITRDTSAS